MAGSEAIQSTVTQVAIQTVVMIMTESGAGPWSGTNAASMGEACRQNMADQH